MPLLLLLIFISCEDDLCDTSIAEVNDDITENTTWYGMEINDGFNTPICGSNVLYSETCN